ncbi:GNAT family N-acetyltransferase [Polaribacter gangjinensis]|uniref:GNAT family N-acetyltransferase n=1 Tax=Polaribacter gangjinensis TaxID=574710 RepID=A0A2S7WDB2_9FLAO|nr:GNAT family N-acetyltransferase [Polaribacter gangjinensis]PQJ75262.1 GNAT family N-acetyltransferase [Polaribacter gangjinensis]
MQKTAITLLNYQTKNFNHSFFSRIDAISIEIWEDLDCENNRYFHRNFLKSVEKNHPEIDFYYQILFDNNKKACAIFSIQIIDFEINSIKNNFRLLIKKIQKVTNKIPFLPSSRPFKILIVGNTFISGEHGFFIKETLDKKLVLKEFSKAILQFSNSQSQLQIDAILCKDFKYESLSSTSVFEKFQFKRFSVEPNLVMEINENWKNFNDYLSALKTKFRIKAKKALQQSSELKLIEISPENCEHQLIKMTELYQKVSSNAGFNLANFNVATYKDLKQAFGENYLLQSYWIDDKMVGFLSGMITNNSLDAHFVGIDYSLNKQYAIYQRMLYDYIKIAIDKNLKFVNFGRTASEIKSSVGAIPQDLTIYFRHKKRITNRILHLFLQRVQPTAFQQKFPFKNTETI